MYLFTYTVTDWDEMARGASLCYKFIISLISGSAMAHPKNFSFVHLPTLNVFKNIKFHFVTNFNS